ncbi:hypothetical protein MKW92_004981, partial [Papaver armeniacum]
FKYSRGAHNIVRVDASGYRKCKVSTTDLAKALSSGSDKIRLKKELITSSVAYQAIALRHEDESTC